ALLPGAMWPSTGLADANRLVPVGFSILNLRVPCPVLSSTILRAVLCAVSIFTASDNGAAVADGANAEVRLTTLEIADVFPSKSRERMAKKKRVPPGRFVTVNVCASPADRGVTMFCTRV